MKRVPTLADVAQAAGVSKSAASKAINDRTDVSAATVAKVRAAVDQLGYVVKTRSAATDVVALWVVIDGLGNYYSPQVLEGIVLEAEESGAVAVVAQRQGSPHARRPGSPAWMADAAGKGAQAFILVATDVTAATISAAEQADVPLVVLDPVMRLSSGVATVGATNFRGGVEATEHLVGLGHTRIAFIGANPRSHAGGDRLAGYHDALRRAGIAPDPDLVVPGHFHTEDGLAAEDLLRRRNRPTAIFCGSDSVALGVYEACHSLGLRVPEDVSVVGFDDGLGADVATPHLTTVRQPLEQMGRLAVRTAVAAVVGGGPLAPPLEVATKLIVRDSTAPPAQRD